MNRSLLVGLVLVTAISTVGCASSRRIREVDSGGQFQMKVGRELQVDLAADSATGASWSWDGAGESLLTLVDQARVDQADEPGKVLGAGGIQRWRFRADVPGSTTLRFELRRPGEGSALRSATYSIVVN